MNVAVVVPWRPGGCRHRLVAWERVRTEWDGAWPLFTADDGGEPFSRAASINLAVAEHQADVYVIADADTLINLAQVAAAIELAAWSPGMVVAFDRFAYLSEKGTQDVLDGRDGSWELLIDWSLQNTVSSCVALSHDTWTAVGGFDPRFRAWGYEDIQLEVTAATLVAPTRRIPGTCWHLAHPPTRDRPRRNAGWLDEYLRLRDDPEGMRAHLSAVQRKFRATAEGAGAVLPALPTAAPQRESLPVELGEPSEEGGDPQEVDRRERRADERAASSMASSEPREGSHHPSPREEEPPRRESVLRAREAGAAAWADGGLVHARATPGAARLLRQPVLDVRSGGHDARPREAALEGRPAHAGQHAAGVFGVQQPQERSVAR